MSAPKIITVPNEVAAARNGSVDLNTRILNIENTAADMTRIPLYAVATGSANTYTISTTPAPTSYIDGMGAIVKINITCTGASTLNWNGLGPKAILDSLGNQITSGGLKLNTPYTMRYNGTAFIVQGKGGGGNTIASHVLAGDTCTVDSGPITGTMPNKVGSATIITPSTTDQAILQGYYGGVVGDGKVSGDANLIASNILSGKSIFGITGNVTPKQYATGTVTSSSTTVAAYNSNNGSSNYYYVSVSGLTFTPTLILLMGTSASWVFTTYKSGVDFLHGTYPCPIISGSAGSDYGVQLTGSLSVTSTSFQLPVLMSSTSFTWYAFA